MKKDAILFYIVSIIGVIVLLMGFTPSGSDQNIKADENSGRLENALAQAEEPAAGMETSFSEASAAQAAMLTGDTSLFPPNAKPGECWARAFVPPTYRTHTETILSKGPAERLEIIPAEFEWVEETVMVKEASEELEIIPAQYDWAEEKVLVRPASSKLVEVPASFEWQEEKILVKEAHTVWKKGRGPIEKVDNLTGEIICLVEVPASYRTVKKWVMTSPPATKTVEIPAEYKTIKKRVMVKAPETRRITIPAEYKTVKVRKLVSPAREQRINIDAEYQTVTRTEKVSDGHMAWRRIFCETNMNADVIKRIQLALRDAGHDPGPIDGVIGYETRMAIESYQRANNLAVGELTYETIENMGLTL
jgi:hypothetical protein